MKRQHFMEPSGNEADKFQTDEYQRCLPIFQRLGLKPRRYFSDREAIYVGTIEGWFRLSLKKYSKQELKWLRRILEYLNERSFHNWAVPWQKTIIWEEHAFCYLIQPWFMAKEFFQATDPASVSRVAEITTELYNCGKDYFENRAIEIARDRWQSIDLEWETQLFKLDQLKIDFEHEKLRKDIDELKKSAIIALNDSLDSWRKSGLTSLLEHHQRSGVLGHGNLLIKNIVWLNNDYYLLNWEGLAFQPRIVDIASLINDVAWWEPEWILFLLNEYAKIQPFWPEEHMALFALLKYPQKIMELLGSEMNEESLNRKDLKEEARELARKERCLVKAWKELGTQKRWVWGQQTDMPSVGQGKISMVLSPVESWGEFAGQADSLIHVKHEQKLPKDVMERLTYNESDQVVAGRDGNVLESAAKIDANANYNESNFIEIVEPQPKIPDETELEQAAEAAKAVSEQTLTNSTIPEMKDKDVKDKEVKAKEVKANDEPLFSKTEVKKNTPYVTTWAKFPKPLGANKKLGDR
jgi:Phosphotransferase enzyme family.